MKQAERGMEELLEGVDTMIVIPNEKLLAVAKDAGFFESFRIADDVLLQGVQGISDIITIPGIINRDFADVKTTMAGMGYAVMGTAIRRGDNRAIAAAQAAMASPLLEAGAIDGARGILINISGSSSLKLTEVNAASTLIQNAAHEDANIIFGAVLDESMGDDVKITVIATGFRPEQLGRRTRLINDAMVPHLSVQARPPVPRFASEELADQEPPPGGLDSPPMPEPPEPQGLERHEMMEVLLEPPPFVLEPMPVAHPILQEPAPAARIPVVHARYDEPFEEEYARLVPDRERESIASGRGFTDRAREAAETLAARSGEDLDIPAFLRRP
jgi:cell division protein FtsZ